MTGIMKRILSAFVAVTMLLSMTVFVAAETSEKPQVLFTVGEADDNGVFSAVLSMHNAAFLGMQFGITYNKDAIVAVDSAGEATEDFNKAVTAYSYETEESSIGFTLVNKKLSNETGEIHVASITTQTQGKLLEVGEEGFAAYEFRFKKIGDGDYGFDLADYPYGTYVKEAIISNGGDPVSLQFKFVCENGKEYDLEREALPEPEKPVVPDNNGGEVDPVDPLREERKAGTIVLQIDNYAVSLNGMLKWVDKDNKNVVPYIENDRTMVPLRFISEAFGAEVTWDAETETVGIALDNAEITMQINNQTYTLNGEAAEMDVAPVIRESRTMVPLRFVSEALNKSVYWNGTTRVVVIAPIDKPWDDKDPTTQQLMTDTLWMFKWLRDEAYAHEK